MILLGSENSTSYDFMQIEFVPRQIDDEQIGLYHYKLIGVLQHRVLCHLTASDLNGFNDIFAA